MLTVWQALADLVTEKDLNEGRLYPSLSTIGDVSFKLAVRVRAQWSHIKRAEALDHVFVRVHLHEGLRNCNKIQSSKNLCVLQIMEYAYEHNLATLRPEPSDKEAYVRSLTYSTEYDEFVVDSYRWPTDSMTVQSCKL